VFDFSDSDWPQSVCIVVNSTVFLCTENKGPFLYSGYKPRKMYIKFDYVLVEMLYTNSTILL